MSHPSRPDLNITPSISSALAMEQQQQQQQQQQQSPTTPQHDGQQAGSTGSSSRKRKKAVTDGEETPSTSEPRRLRRSHEACARCRSKKIKASACDSKHPRCTACATAGVQCNQEDRHRKTLTPRGHVEKVERQLLQCQALLRRHISGFSLDDLDNILAREGIDIEPSTDDVADNFQFSPPTDHRPYPRHDGPLPQMPKNYPYPPPPHMIHPGYPPMGVPGYPPPPHPNAPYPPMGMPPAGMYDPRIHPAFQHPHMPPPPPTHLRPDMDIKGQDPQANDMSNAQALAKNFGVAPHIVTEAKLSSVPVGAEMEDLAVGSGGLSSGRDRDLTETSPPRDVVNWIDVNMQYVSAAGYGSNARVRDVPIWLPKDRTMAIAIVDVYFKQLNLHRPVLSRNDFEGRLSQLYEKQPAVYDPGYVCNLYLVLALGTMSELNKAAGNAMEDESRTNLKKVLAPGWPEHEEFFERALAVKPDLRMTITSLQALILLHWYLYTERQQRSLWRLVGSLVRVAIELGLHHDPFQQGQTFTEDESQLRIRLWSIVMIHDRGTSILLGRPLAISPADTSTPHPSRGKLIDFSEHFFLSAPVAEIQADIVNALYSPTRHNQEAIMRNATRIIKSMDEFRKQLPDSYAHFFGGTQNWKIEQKRKLVEGITEDQGLTLLKVGIARILLLRALFSSSELPYNERRRALNDAIVASHNVIVVHYTLIKFPDIAFFVSPIPLHIAAMVILYGQMSQCDVLPREIAVEDIWYALDMLPRFRWRWERKDMNGAHPLIEKLAEKVLDINLSEMKRSGTPVLIPEDDWDASSPTGGGSLSPTTGPLLSPKHSRTSFPGPYANTHNSDNVNGKTLAEVPAGWFWPMDPQNPVGLPLEQVQIPGQAQNTVQLYQPIGTIGCQPSQESFVLEEKDPAVTKAHVQTWMNQVSLQMKLSLHST
ncbi:fungal-specific transcription factor domain-containing protein [Phellopilus nigrolimitatus]|nr:fungal-specific transcription factor domain-containing protein [Phellopilus nigrolimitatus]